MQSYIFKKLEMSIAVHTRETKCCESTVHLFSLQYLLRNAYILNSVFVQISSGRVSENIILLRQDFKR